MSEPTVDLKEGFTIERALLETIADVAFRLGFSIARSNPNEQKGGDKYTYFLKAMNTLAVESAKAGHITALPKWPVA
jgi:hypothetical protein